MSVFKRKRSPHFYVEVQIANRRVIRSAGTSVRREAEAFQRKLREELREEAKRLGSQTARARQAALDYTIDQMFGRYWIEHGNKLRWAHEVAGYAKRIVAVIGHVKVADLTSVDIAHMVETLRDKGTGNVAINRALAVLRGAYTMAGKRWGCSVHPMDWRLLKSKEPKERIRWITREEAALLLSYLPIHSQLIVEWSLYTGLRKGETLRLLWDDVNITLGWADVRVKGGHVRRVILSEAARDVLARTPHVGRLVFDGTNLRKNFEAALNLAGIKNFRFHDLRHTNATWMRQEGASLEIIQRHLGHSGIQVTQRYAHVDDKEVLAAANAVAPLQSTNVVRFVPKAKPQFVYFICDGSRVKIGRSSDPERRLRVLQTANAERMWLLGSIRADLMSELEAHSRFCKQRVRGEWFAVTPAVLKEIEVVCKAANHEHVSGSTRGLTDSSSS